MWTVASKAISGALGLRHDSSKSKAISAAPESSDDEISLKNRGEERLECPVCWESFNIVENVPYVLWCGHSLCKNCVMRLQRAVVKFPTVPLQLPFFISCSWCNLLSLRLFYKGDLKFPSKNYFTLWMVESMNGDRTKSGSSGCRSQQNSYSVRRNSPVRNRVSHINIRQSRHSEHNHHQPHVMTGYLHSGRLQLSVRKSLAFFAHLTTKFPLIIVLILIIIYAIPAVLILIIIYAIPASLVIFALFILITIVFAIPSILVLYFAFPTMDWLVRELVN